MPHAANWYTGWSMMLAAFATGAVIGLFFAREQFLGGYASWRRRIIRLGHIALAALGLVNIVYGISPLPATAHSTSHWVLGGAGIALIVGGIAMPAVCFLSAWKKPFKSFFFIPVGALMAAVVMILIA